MIDEEESYYKKYYRFVAVNEHEIGLKFSDGIQEEYVAVHVKTEPIVCFENDNNNDFRDKLCKLMNKYMNELFNDD